MFSLGLKCQRVPVLNNITLDLKLLVCSRSRGTEKQTRDPRAAFLNPTVAARKLSPKKAPCSARPLLLLHGKGVGEGFDTGLVGAPTPTGLQSGLSRVQASQPWRREINEKKEKCVDLSHADRRRSIVNKHAAILI